MESLDETGVQPPASVEERPHQPFAEGESGAIPRKLFMLVGILLLAGLVITAVFVRTWSPSSGYSPARIAALSTQMAEPVVDRTPPASPPKVVADPGAQRKSSAAMEGPTGVISVPSAALRAGPSLEAKPLKAVVKHRERVRILKRVAASSGPDWLQVQTASGRTGWVWASVVKEAKKRG